MGNRCISKSFVTREINFKISVNLSVKCYRDFPNPDFEA